jgi:hypothetical protein
MIGRPETHPIKKIIGFSDDMIFAIERWRAKQKPVPNLSEAIRRLVELGLKASKPTKGTRSPPNKRRAAELAAKTIGMLVDVSTPVEEINRRRQRLTKGPVEFREHRVDLAKAKRK